MLPRPALFHLPALTFLGLVSLFGAEDDEPPPAPAKPSTAPRSPAELKIERALTLRKGGQWNDSLATLGEALALEPPPPVAADVLFRLGETHFRIGQETASGNLAGKPAEESFLEAIKHLEEAMRRYPKEEKGADAAYLIGSAYVMLQDGEKALAAYRKAFEEFPALKNRATALLRVGICEAGLGRDAEARKTFDRVVREFPQDAMAGRARKHLAEMTVVGRPAAPLRASSWLVGMAPDGLKTFEGHVVALVFFATWCKNCSAEVPHLRRLMKDLGDQGVTFLGVANPDDPENPEPVDVYVQKKELPFLDVALDRTQASWTPYRVAALPAAVLIDRKGTIRWRGHPAFFPVGLAQKLLEEK